MKSWKKYCPDYEIILWNEDNFDINSTAWTKEAYEAGKYAFVADYVRLKALYECGGVYLDTDQELIKSLDPFLDNEAFLGFLDVCLDESGLCNAGVVGAGVVGAGHELIGEMLQYYDNRHFIVDGKMDKIPNTDWMTEILKSHGLIMNNQLQVVDGCTVYPRTFFCPTSAVSIEDDTSQDTVAIHHWAMSWRKPSEIKTFKKVKRHQRRWYRTLEYLRYTPNRLARFIFGDGFIDNLKRRLGK
jgi:hypothetical protein